MKSGLFTAFICLVLLNGKTHAQANTNDQDQKIQMKQYSLLIRVPNSYTTEEARVVGPLWDQLLEKWKAEGVYVLSFAFPGESYTVSGKERIIKKETVLSAKLKVVSNLVLRAESIEQALALAKSCPILLYGGKVEVREIPRPVKPIE